MLSHIHALELSLGVDAQQVELHERVENQPAPGTRPEYDADTSGNVDAEVEPGIDRAALIS